MILCNKLISLNEKYYHTILLLMKIILNCNNNILIKSLVEIPVLFNVFNTSQHHSDTLIQTMTVVAALLQGVPFKSPPFELGVAYCPHS